MTKIKTPFLSFIAISLIFVVSAGQAQTVKSVFFAQPVSGSRITTIQNGKSYAISSLPSDVGLIVEVPQTAALKAAIKRAKKTPTKKNKRDAAVKTPIVDFTFKNADNSIRVSGREKNIPYSVFGDFSGVVRGITDYAKDSNLNYSTLPAGKYSLYITIVDPVTLKGVSSYKTAFVLTSSVATPTPFPTKVITPNPVATNTPKPTNTPVKTSTPKAVNTPVKTATPNATSTPVKTATPKPNSTNTPKPTATSTPKPTVAAATPTPSSSDIKFSQYNFKYCKGQGCGKSVTVLDSSVGTADIYSNRTTYGGIASEKVNNGTGFFSVAEFNGRKVLVDPTGYRYFDVGLDSVAPGALSKSNAGDAYKTDDNFAQLFKGGKSEWAGVTRDLLKHSGINTLGAWSDQTLFYNQSLRMNYTVLTNFLKDYCTQKDPAKASYTSKQCAADPELCGLCAKSGTGHADFVVEGMSGTIKNVLPVFDDGFKAFAEKTMDTLINKDKDTGKDKLRIADPYMVGIMTDNELPLGYQSLATYLKLKDGGKTKTAAVNYDKNGTLDPEFVASYPAYTSLGSKDKIWQAFVSWKYAKVCHDAIRKYDSNHLILGSRFTWPTIQDEPTWLAQQSIYPANDKRNLLDVVSVNWYNDIIWTTIGNKTNDLAKKYHMPVLITEFYAKGNDMNGTNGINNSGGAGIVVKDQLERGMHYQGLLTHAIGSQNVTGVHYFMYMDNNPGASSDPSNKSSNKGIVNIYWETYDDFLNQVKRYNSNLGKIIPMLENHQ